MAGQPLAHFLGGDVPDDNGEIAHSRAAGQQPVIQGKRETRAEGKVARRMDMKRNALYKLLHDARLRLKKRLANEGLTVEDVWAAFDRG